MGKNFKGTLERGREGAEQGGIYGMVEGLQDGFRGVPKPTPPSVPTASAEPAAPRMAGDIAAPSRGREYRSVGDFRGFK